jgi:hypothetical protein
MYDWPQGRSRLRLSLITPASTNDLALMEQSELAERPFRLDPRTKVSSCCGSELRGATAAGVAPAFHEVAARIRRRAEKNQCLLGRRALMIAVRLRPIWSSVNSRTSQ